MEEAFISPLVFTLARTQDPYTFQTDACHKHMGCILPQEEEDETSPLLATGVTIWMTKSKNWPQHKESA